MGECERLATCPFFQEKMANMPKTSELLKATYCKGDFTKCARYLVFKAGVKVPSYLFPYDREGAELRIKENKK